MSSHLAALRSEVNRLLPEYELEIPDWEILSDPTPCERCGTTLVLLRFPPPARNWFEVTEQVLTDRLYRRHDGWRTGLAWHHPDNCRAARQLFATAIDLDAVLADVAVPALRVIASRTADAALEKLAGGASGFPAVGAR